MSDPMTRLAAALADRYRIERELGQGGMATVYLAQDLKHDRNVAIKVLRPELAAVLGAERFVQEIKTTAALSHPHILPLFDSGEAGGFLYYVMPYIEGETIRDRLNRETQLGVDEAVRIAAEVADALDYAHRRGVIHRDIKPENVLLHDGRPMVMDFGIALAVSAAAGGRMTETGLSLGTPHYMSPEQATADKAITARSDVYSLASVLYEMLAGEPPHSGGSAQAIIMKIIAERPQPVTELRRAVPRNVAAALEKALEKLPADRFESASGFAQALANPHFVTAPAAGAAGAGPHRGVRSGVFAAAAAALAIVAAVGWLREPPVPERTVARFTIDAEGMTRGIEVSPDGSDVLFASSASGMRLRPLDGDSVVTVPYRATNGRISPDGRRLLGTLVNGDIIVADLRGGASRVIARQRPGGEVVWGHDGFVYFTMDGILARVPEAGGAIDTLIPRDSVNRRLVPKDALPDGRTLLVTRSWGAGDTVALFDVGRRTTTPLLVTTGRVLYARYAPAGYLVYNEENRILARRFEPRRGTVDADAVTVAQGPPGRTLGFGLGGTTLAFAPQGGGTGTLVVTDRRGALRTLPNLPPGEYNVPRVSPDGERIAVYRIGPTGETDVWVYRMPAGPLTQLTRTGDLGRATLSWTSDGARVVYGRSDRPGDLYWQPYDGAGVEELMLHRDGLVRPTLSPDGRRLLYSDQGGDVRTGPVDATEGDRVVLRGVTPRFVQWSPDGRWVVFGVPGDPQQIFVQPLAGAGRRVQVSVRSGIDPKWSRDGRKLYFLDGADLMEATFAAGTDPRVASLVRLPFYDQAGATWDVFPDDDRFVMTRTAAEGSVRFGLITVITNFDALLARLAQAAR
jgi:eukaryotic-like serine/threonine-protein kinase